MAREPEPDGGSGIGDGPLPDDARSGQFGLDEFELIVAGWRREGDVPVWPEEPADDDPRPTAPLFENPVVRPPVAPPPVILPPVPPPPVTPPPAPVRPPTGPPVADEDEHFVPPEPPPLPRLGPPALVGLALIVLGLVLVVAPGWVGVPTPYGLPLGLVGIAAGLGWLVLRLWPDQGADDRDEGDDGAVL